METEWIKIIYRTSEGRPVKEIWAQTFIQDLPDVDREMQEAMISINAPTITHQIVDRSETPPPKESSQLSSPELIDLLISETCDEAVFAFVAAISAYGIENRDDAIAAIDKDKDARQWAEDTARISWPYFTPPRKLL